MRTLEREVQSERLRFIRLSALAGMAAPVFFVAAFTLEGWFRPGYDPKSMFVSELSIGPGGWLQMVNFIITGALVFFFARGLPLPFADQKRVGVVSVLLQLIGLSLLMSGPFVTDPAALFNQHTVRGLIHGIFGAVVFSLAPVTCFFAFRLFRGSAQWRAGALWTLLVCLFLVVGIGLLKVSQFPQSDLYAWKGLIQRAILIVFLGWLFAFAERLFRSPAPERRRADAGQLPGTPLD